MRELAADDGSRDMKSWMQRAYAYLFQADMFASVSSNDTLMRIHSSAEEYDKATEELFALFQVSAGGSTLHASCIHILVITCNTLLCIVSAALLPEQMPGDTWLGGGRGGFAAAGGWRCGGARATLCCTLLSTLA